MTLPAPDLVTVAPAEEVVPLALEAEDEAADTEEARDVEAEEGAAEAELAWELVVALEELALALTLDARLELIEAVEEVGREVIVEVVVAT